MKISTDNVITARQELIELIDVMEQEKKVGGLTDIVLSKEQADSHLAIIDWAIERLQKQKDNSRIYLAKNKIMNKLLKEQFSADELAEIDRQAKLKAGV
jgi:hypothetical protein